jgi:curved DNA-binding protein CbpA
MAAPIFIDFYELLDVDPDADIEKIRAAYRATIAAIHPDRPSATAEDLEKAKMLNVGKEILLNPEKRARYDEERLKRLRADPKSVSVPTPSSGISVEACLLITVAAIGISLITTLLARWHAADASPGRAPGRPMGQGAAERRAGSAANSATW